MFSEKQLASNLSLVVDVAGKFNHVSESSCRPTSSLATGRGITEVSQIPGGGRDVAALTADNNKLLTLNGVQKFASLVQVCVEYVWHENFLFYPLKAKNLFFHLSFFFHRSLLPPSSLPAPTV